MNSLLDTSVSIDQLRAALPWWVSWGAPLGALVFIFVMNWAYGALITHMFRRAYRRTESEHWTERARHTWPWRSHMSAALMFIPTVVTAMVLRRLGPLSPIELRQFIVLAFVAAFMGTHIGLDLRQPRERETKKGWRYTVRLLVFAHVMSGLMLPMLLASTLLTSSDVKSPMAWIPAAISLCVFVWLTRGGASFLLRWLKIMRPVTPDLDAQIRAVCESRGVQCRGSYTAPFPSANALALMATKEVVLVGGFEDLLEGEEFDAVIAHEAGHLSESDQIVWSRLVLGSSTLLLPLLFPLVSRFGFRSALVFFFGVFLVSKASTRLSRRMEERADEHAEGAALARGLEKIHEKNLIPAVLKKNTSHPSLSSRMKAAGVEPSWPIPSPPSNWVLMAPTTLAALVVVGAAVFWKNEQERHREEQDWLLPPAHAFAALSAGGHPSLFYLGNAWHWDGEEELGDGAFAAAFSEEPTAWTAARIVRTLEYFEDPDAMEWRERALELSADWPAAEIEELIAWIDA